ncbi:uncharacterized protein LOC127290915 [Leptopilina boulardi]|uniref:uncharacterized protein LOC127290915 n=1 Tax=Leptopilina boulardi TaxID=63433 RepID=UPI0021F5B7C4|nr:uncharacterized protein LOC127290915 [Leptopilina boulardi]
MKHRFVYIFVLVLVISSAIGRVYYVDNTNSIPANEPINFVDENVEQSSRDLDLSFAAGDFNDGLENYRPAVKKVYAYGVPELRQFVDNSKDIVRPPAYYRISEVPPTRKSSGWGEMFFVPERNRKLVKLNNGHKGEVLLELRVTANNDGV